MVDSYYFEIELKTIDFNTSLLEQKPTTRPHIKNMDMINLIACTQQETLTSVNENSETSTENTTTTICIPTVDLTVPTINIEEVTPPAYFTPIRPPVVDLSQDDSRGIELFPAPAINTVTDVPINSAQGNTVSPDNGVGQNGGGRRAAFLTEATTMYTQIGQVISSLNRIVGHEEAIANEARGRLILQQTPKKKCKRFGREVTDLMKGCTDMKRAKRRR